MRYQDGETVMVHNKLNMYEIIDSYIDELDGTRFYRITQLDTDRFLIKKECNLISIRERLTLSSYVNDMVTL